MIQTITVAREYGSGGAEVGRHIENQSVTPSRASSPNGVRRIELVIRGRRSPS